MGDTDVVERPDYREQINNQKAEYDELMQADSEAGRMLQENVNSVHSEKGRDEENEEEAESKIVQYLAAHNEGKVGNEYLVRGAELKCTCGTNKRKLNLGECHGVYIKGHAVVHELDCIQGDTENITWFGACKSAKEELETDDILVVGDDGKKRSGKKCKPHIIGVWMDSYDATKIVDNGDKITDDTGNPVACNTLTVGSFLVCKYGGIIAPMNSGQAREIKEEEFCCGKEAYDRVMQFECKTDIDREGGCADLLHAMTDTEESNVHGSVFGETEQDEVDVGTISSDKKFYYDNIEQLLAQVSEIDPDNRFSYDIWNFKRIYSENQEIYEEVSRQTGVPPALIAAIHYRESACNFDTYLHNGQPLGQKTTIVPRDVSYDDFVEAAVDALNTQQDSKGIHLTVDSDIVMMMTFAEIYNGTGYTDYRNIASPYVFSGTEVYKEGKYISDGSFSSTQVDAQPGVYILVMSVLNEENNE